MQSAGDICMIRLTPHTDLKKAIMEYAEKHNMKAGIVLTCVGSLEQYHLRFAHQEKGSKSTGHFEIVSLAGTFSDSACHLHLSVSDSLGLTIGGHMLEGNLIYTTAEIALAELTDIEFARVTDPTYGFKELVVNPRHKNPHS
ncbi:MAG: PPC domain-containing DNA-binding protein [Bacteroidota bacterium]